MANVVPLALIMSSFVAASRIGGSAQQYVLAAHRIDPVLAPTSLYGRSPAKGSQGEVTQPEVFARMLADMEADATFGLLDLVITGHFSLPEQVEIAAGVLRRVRAASERPPVVVVDPIMGDAPKGLYVPEAVAEAVARHLVPLADWITPNLWELSRLARRPVTTLAEARAAVDIVGRPALVTSAPAGDGQIGLLFDDGAEAVLFGHPRLETVPSGTGDLVAATFGAGLTKGLSGRAAAELAARAVADAAAAAQDSRSSDLPLVAMAERLAQPSAQVSVLRLA